MVFTSFMELFVRLHEKDVAEEGRTALINALQDAFTDDTNVSLSDLLLGLGKTPNESQESEKFYRNLFMKKVGIVGIEKISEAFTEQQRITEKGLNLEPPEFPHEFVGLSDLCG